MLKGVDNSLDDAKRLVQAAEGHSRQDQSHPVRSVAGSLYECSDWDQIEKFSEYVFDAGCSSPVRTPRGRDILAACGPAEVGNREALARANGQALRAMAMTDRGEIG